MNINDKPSGGRVVSSRIPIRHVSNSTHVGSPVHTPPAHRINVHVEDDSESIQSGDLLNNSHVEQQMDMEVEKVLREWDSNVQRRTQDTFSLRPKSSASQRKRLSETTPKSGSIEDNLHRRVFEFPEIDVIRRQDTSYDSSNDTFEEDPRTPLYVHHPQTGQKMFHMDFDITGYDEKNITVKVSGSRLVVHAIQSIDGVGKKSSTEFCRKIKLPRDVDKRLLQCNFNHDTNTLIVEAPLICQSAPPVPTANTPTFPAASPRPETVNQPIIKPDTNGTRQLHLVVEVGHVFKSDDVVVKIRGQNKVVVNAERDESNASSKLSAKLSREFDLSHKVDPHTLKAGLTTDGLLRITALVIEEGSEGGSSAAENTSNMVRTEID